MARNNIWLSIGVLQISAHKYTKTSVYNILNITGKVPGCCIAHLGAITQFDSSGTQIDWIIDDVWMYSGETNTSVSPTAVYL